MTVTRRSILPVAVACWLLWAPAIAAQLVVSPELDLFDPSATSFDGYGFEVALSGDTAAVMQYSDPTDPGQSRVFVYVRNGPSWELQALLDAGTTPSGVMRGALALDGDTLAVGADVADAGGFPSGEVTVFRRQTGVWGVEAVLLPSLPVPFHAFGRTLALDGDVLAVGAHSAVPAIPFVQGNLTGQVYVFHRAAGAWSEEAHLTMPLGELTWSTPQPFGEALAVSGDTLAVGAPRWYSGTLIEGLGAVGGPPPKSEVTPPAGAVYVYTRVAGDWLLEARVTGRSVQTNSRFGAAVGLDGDRLCVGVPQDATPGVHVFERVAGDWQQTARLTPGVHYSQAGWSLDLVGDLLAVGRKAPAQVSLFHHGVGGWAEVAQATSPFATSTSSYSISVALTADRLLVGSPYADGPAGLSIGLAHLYSLSGL